MASQAEIDLIVDATNTLPQLTRDLTRIVQIAEANAPTINIPVDVDREGTLRRLNSSLGPALGSLGRLGAGIAGVGLAAGSALPLVAGAAAAIQNIVPAAAVATQGMLAMQLVSGTLKLAMVGVEDAVSAAFDPEATPAELAEAMAKLAPEARKTVAALADMKSGFRDLQLGVQNRLFQDLDSSVTELGSAVLPQVRTALNETADALNLMAKGAAQAAVDMGDNGTLGTALKGATAGIENLARVPGQAVAGFAQLAAAAAPAFDRITNAAAGAADGISEKLAKAFESGALEDAINEAIDAIAQLGRVGGNVFEGLGNILSAVTTDGKGLFDVMEQVSQAFADATASTELQGAFKELSLVASEVARQVLPLFVDALKIVGSIIQVIGPPIRELVKVVGEGLAGALEAAEPVLLALAGAAAKLIPALAPVVELFFDLVTALLPALTPLFDGLGQIIEAVTPFIEQLANVLAAQLVPMFEALGPILEVLIPPLVEMATTIFPVLTNILAELAPSLLELSNEFAALAVEAAPLVAQLIEMSSVVGEALIPVLGPILINAIQIFTAVLRGVASVLREFVIPAVETISELLTGVFSGSNVEAAEAAQKFSNTVKTAISSMVASVTMKLAEYVTSLRGKANDGARAFLEGVARMSSNVRVKIAELPGIIQGALGNLGNLLYSAGASIIEGLISGITSKISSLVSTLSGITNMIPDLKGPAVRDAKLLTPSGELIMEGLMAGIQSELPELTAQLQAITVGIPNTVNQTVSPIGQRFNIAPRGVPAVFVSIGNEAVDRYVTVRTNQALDARERTHAQGVRR